MTGHRKRGGLPFLEVVIALLFLGLLNLAVIRLFRRVPVEARFRVFEENCHTVVSAIGMCQAGRLGAVPQTTDELDPYLRDGWAGLQDKPVGAVYQYQYENGVGTFTASFLERTFTYDAETGTVTEY